MKEKAKILIIFVLIFLTTGCFDRREIRDLAIVNSILFDYKDNKVIFMAELINAKAEGVGAKGSTQFVPYLYLQGEGKDILEATSDCSLSISKIIYYSHMRAVFLSENFVKEKGITPILDLLSRVWEMRQNSYLVVVKDKAIDDFYKSSTSYSNFFGTFIEDGNKSQSGRLSKSLFVTVLDAIKDHYDKGKQGVLGVIEVSPLVSDEVNNPIVGSYDKYKNNNKIENKGMAVLKNDKLWAFLDEDDTIMYNYIIGKARQLNLTVENDSFAVRNIKTKVNTKMDKNNKVTIDITINIDTTITMSMSKEDFSDSDTIKKLESKINLNLEKKLSAFLDKSQKEIEIDFFGFGDYFHIQNPKEWKNIENDWDKYFKDADIKVKVDSNIISSGKMTKSFKVGG